MQPAGIHVGDVGTQLRLVIETPEGLPFDVSQAATKTLSLAKPDGSTISRDCTFETDGADGVLLYVTQTGDVNSAGIWYAQAVVTFDDGTTFHSNRQRFRVWANNA